jgi:hypothetical protein
MSFKRARKVARKNHAGFGADPGSASRPAVANWVLQSDDGGVHVSSSSNRVARSIPAASATRRSRTSHWPWTMKAELDPSAGAWRGELAYVS